jgi:hypothetical protein
MITDTLKKISKILDESTIKDGRIATLGMLDFLHEEYRVVMIKQSMQGPKLPTLSETLSALSVNGNDELSQAERHGINRTWDYFSRQLQAGT